jgi:thioredoxin reductase (NADPH)
MLELSNLSASVTHFPLIREPPLSQSIGPRMDEEILDCLIIGGGPAGLTAAIYLARFHLDILVVDGGKSRASSIPCTRNHAGYPEGIAGKELLRRMREQACKYGAKIETEVVTRLERGEDGLFTAAWGSGSATARAVLLATGITNRRPPMEEELHDDALARGLVRYCPICDGYEVTDKRVGVIGSDSHGVAEAVFVRSYTADVTLIAPDTALLLKPEDSRKLKAAGIECVDGPAQAVAITGECIVVDTAEGHYTFDSIYPALGSDTHTQLAEMVGADLSGDSCIKVDSHQRTSVAGLYAAGDVVIGLDQISHAMGEGGVAATTIRNDLCVNEPRWREPVQELVDAEDGT